MFKENLMNLNRRDFIKLCAKTAIVGSGIGAGLFTGLGKPIEELTTSKEGKVLIDGKYGMGWLPDPLDNRDYTIEHESIIEMFEKAGVPMNAKLNTSVDLRAWCSPIENQGQLESSTANAGAGIVEYFENRAFGKYLDASRLFIYKVTRNFAKLTGDSGAFLRNTMGALVLFGVPPEEYWPYTDKTPDFDMEPTVFCYSFAQNYKTIKYFRHDSPSITKPDLLQSIKKSLAAGIPSMFGFTIFSSISQAGASGKIPLPCDNEEIMGGHAVVAVGYDDNMVINNSQCGTPTTGALLIRNSWGEEWGEKGYGWLPYEYIMKDLAKDFWSMLQMNWVDTGIFGGLYTDPI